MNTFRSEIGIQEQLRLVEIDVTGNIDHLREVERLERLDLLLKHSCLEAHAIDLYFEGLFDEVCARVSDVGERQRHLESLNDRRQHLAQEAVTALRVNVLRHELGLPSIRSLSKLISGNPEYARFCGLLSGNRVAGSSKSRLDRLTRLFDEEELRQLHQSLTAAAGSEDLCGQISMAEPLSMKTALADGTCIEANIHHPADWTLLADVARTLVQALERIRERGLLWRMPVSPQALMNRFNKLCIQMTHTRRRKNGKAAHKGVLREMKRLLKTVGAHARRHLELLVCHWEAYGFTHGAMVRLRGRIERMLKLLPMVSKQAHERIIGGRKVANADKILSVYDPDVHVLIRGKSGKEIEYGNHCFLAENEAGFIMDWKLYRNIAPGEPEQLRDSIRRQWKLKVDDELEVAVTDRGLNSKRNTRFLKRNRIGDATCPRDPDVLKKRLQDEEFKRLQKRRGGTEARIAIIKNSRLGGRIRAKGFDNRATTLAWSILSHNLWLLSRLVEAEARNRKKAA
jgi:hypothetical protein